MKLELRDSWIEALRSGNYEQTRGELYSNGSYCALGVLCDVAKVPYYETGRFRHQRAYGHESKDRFKLKDSTMKRLDLLYSETRVITRMNDDECKTFDQIADYVERNL